MFKAVFSNKKRFVRNGAITITAFVISAILFGFLFYQFNVNLPVYAISLISSIGSIGLTFAIVVILALFANSSDSKKRNRLVAEIAHQGSESLLSANGLESKIKTDRSASEIKRDIKKLTSELFHAVERDKNLKSLKRM